MQNEPLSGTLRPIVETSLEHALNTDELQSWSSAHSELTARHTPSSAPLSSGETVVRTQLSPPVQPCLASSTVQRVRHSPAAVHAPAHDDGVAGLHLGTQNDPPSVCVAV